jgi:hypothetical protein
LYRRERSTPSSYSDTVLVAHVRIPPYRIVIDPAATVKEKPAKYGKKRCKTHSRSTRSPMGLTARGAKKIQPSSEVQSPYSATGA